MIDWVEALCKNSKRNYELLFKSRQSLRLMSDNPNFAIFTIKK